MCNVNNRGRLEPKGQPIFVVSCDKACRSEMRRLNIWVALSVVFLLIGFLGLGLVIGMYYASRAAVYEYGVVIDAGSSHTSLYVYNWESSRVSRTGIVKQAARCVVQGQALSRSTDPSNAGDSLKQCLDSARETVPWSLRQYTPLYLGATAGMRLVESKNQTVSNQILDSVRSVVSTYPFRLGDIHQQVRIISGKEEAISLWVTVNFISGALGNLMTSPWYEILPLGSSETLGVLDLGGASTQIAFALNNSAPLSDDLASNIELFGDRLALFSDSFLCYGVDEFAKKLLATLAKNYNYTGVVEHPCFPRGYTMNTTYAKVFSSVCTAADRSEGPLNTSMTVVGSGNSSRCSTLIRKQFNTTFCPLPPCSFNGHPLPSKPDRFLARGAYAYSAKDLNATNDDGYTSKDKFEALMREYCGKPYSEIKSYQLYNPLRVCLNAQYAYVLLSDIFNMDGDAWSRIVFSNVIRDVDIGWALGFMVNATTASPAVPQTSLYDVSTSVFVAVVVTTSVLIIMGFLVLALACGFRKNDRRTLVPTRE